MKLLLTFLACLCWLVFEVQAFGEHKFWSVADMFDLFPADSQNLNISKYSSRYSKSKKHIRVKPINNNYHSNYGSPHKHKPFQLAERSKVHMIRIYGDDFTQYYYMNLMIGHPLRQQSVILDTGSDLTAMPCNCTAVSCGKHNNPNFDPRNSSVFKCHHKFLGYKCRNCDSSKGVCSFKRVYAEGSGLYGTLMLDNVMFGNSTDNMDSNEDSNHSISTPIKMLVGCTNTETGLFSSQLANGIMGLFAKPTKTTYPNMLDLMFKEKVLATNNFALCFARSGGYMTFGGFRTDKHLPGEPVQTVPFNDNYKVGILSIKVGKKKVYQRKFNVSWMVISGMFDSGTTFTFFPSEIHSKAMKQISKHCKSHGKDGCHGVTDFDEDTCLTLDPKKYPQQDDFFKLLPPLIFKFEGGAKYVWEPREYLHQRSLQSPVSFCMTFKVSIFPVPIFGNTFMRNYDIYFDRVKAKIRFVKARCGQEEVASIRPYLNK